MAKTIVGELKDLFVKFGGDADELTGNETTAEMIDALEKVYEDKGDTLPEVTTDDNGKVLGVVEGEWNKATVPNELPAVTSTDNGDVLTVVEGAWNKAAVPNELPAVTSADNGKVLSVANGEWNKVEAGANDYVVTYTPSQDEAPAACDKTFAEITAAIEAGKNIQAKYSVGRCVLMQVAPTSLTYMTITYVYNTLAFTVINHNSSDAITVATKTLS